MKTAYFVAIGENHTNKEFTEKNAYAIIRKKEA
jgi:hypothetical protein